MEKWHRLQSVMVPEIRSQTKVCATLSICFLPPASRSLVPWFLTRAAFLLRLCRLFLCRRSLWSRLRLRWPGLWLRLRRSLLTHLLRGCARRGLLRP